MCYQNLLKMMVGLILITMSLSGCGVPAATANPVPPTEISIPPTDPPTAVPPTETATEASAEGTWTTRADMPTGRWEHDTSVVNGEIYVIGGAGPLYQALGTVEVYDPVTDTWTEKSEMPTARQGLSISVVNDKIYAIGGAESSMPSYSKVETFPTVEEYDPAADTWNEKSPMPSARSWHSANVVDGKIYIIGGTQGSTPGYNYVLAVAVYDPATDSWTQKGDAPREIGFASGSVVDGKIYIIGGLGEPQRVDEYDPATDTWTVKSEMPTKRSELSTSILEGKIYAIGGFSGASIFSSGLATLDVYDPATDSWTTASDMPTGRFGAYSSVVDGKMYVFGGLDHYPSSAYGIVEVYDPN
jgi:N-acetylneuraminic acid mutarotase